MRYGRRRVLATAHGGRVLLAAMACTAAMLVVAALVAPDAAPQAPPPGGFTATPLQPAGAPVDGVKGRTSRIARSDRALLRRTDARPVNVVVKLDYDSVATYDGGIAGLPATSPATTGRKLSENAPAVAAYEQHVAGEEREIVAAVERAVPAAQVRDSYRAVYGGVSMTVPANQAKRLLAVDGVVAVQADRLRRPLTDVTPRFLGATAVWPALGGPSRAGQGVIVGVLDSGITPEHPSFADPGIDHPGGTFACQFGDGSDPDLGPPATCNDKLIGAYAFVDTYLAVLGAEDGEFCNDADTACSARDSDGHGTHTASTAAGGPVASTSIFGIPRGSISGIAPGAHVIAYRVCLDQGCFGSDSVAAIEQAILDGVDVINFSISGGATPFDDPVELAFLEFYEAGGLANASAGNDGPGAGTAEHGGPWVTTVGASTSPRHFLTTLRLSADGATFSAPGATITRGVPEGTPVVLATAIGGDAECTALPASSATGKVVVCKRGGTGRVEKSLRVMEAGGAGMILYNPTRQNLFTDNHWVPAIHVEGPQPAESMLAFLRAHPGATAGWTTGVPTQVRADEMTTFSSRGPVGDFVKPDVTAPGLQILAGQTPTPWPGALASGPPGELFQAIAGTSMSSPHAAGVAALLKAAHPDWTPGQIKSAMMTSSVQDVVKEDGVTPADPFDRGAGSIRADRAVRAPVTFDVTAADYVAAATDPVHRVDLNTPSIDVPAMAGEVTVTRTLKNVTARPLRLAARTEAPPGSSIVVRPARVTVAPGRSATLEIAILGKDLPRNRQFFGEVRLVAESDRQAPATVLPVAFFTRQGDVSLAHACAGTTIARRSATRCQITAQNLSSAPAQATVALSGAQRGRLEVGNVSEPVTPTPDGFRWTGTLSAAVAPEVTAIVPGGSPAGYLPLSSLGIPPIAGVTDESIVTLDGLSPFEFGSERYTEIGMTSNGYAVVGGGTAADVDFIAQTFPNPNRPNNVLAPFWTDLNPGAGGALRAGELTDGVDSWVVLEWENVPTFGQPAQTQSFQIWIRIGENEAISYAYGTVTGTGDPEAGLTVGAENRDGTSGVNLGSVPASGQDLSIVTAKPTPGGSVAIGYDALGRQPGRYQLVARLTSDVTVGTATEAVNLTVTNR